MAAHYSAPPAGAWDKMTRMPRSADTTQAPIDLRSDTVTRPTPAMRRAMADAEVGDDVFREDPTVRLLEETAAALLGKESALFVPSGTMGNQIAVNVWTRPGQEVILEERSHILNYEMGTMAAFSGVLPRPLRGEGGSVTAEAVRGAIRPPVYYLTQTGLIALENTHNMAGGTVFPQTEAESICLLARERGLPVHLDGARIFNAAAAAGREAKDLARPFDSVMFCLSKGLGAPVGSILAGPAKFIGEALRVRKRLGGGMRQAGILAAAGLVALRDNVGRLSDDHANARLLAERCAALPGIDADARRVETNILIFRVASPELTATRLVERWKEAGVLALALDERQVRVVTHYDVSRPQIETAAEALGRIVTGRA
jgi:threonine aldolase